MIQYVCNGTFVFPLHRVTILNLKNMQLNSKQHCNAIQMENLLINWIRNKNEDNIRLSHACSFDESLPSEISVIQARCENVLSMMRQHDKASNCQDLPLSFLPEVKSTVSQSRPSSA